MNPVAYLLEHIHTIIIAKLTVGDESILSTSALAAC